MLGAEAHPPAHLPREEEREAALPASLSSNSRVNSLHDRFYSEKSRRGHVKKKNIV